MNLKAWDVSEGIIILNESVEELVQLMEVNSNFFFDKYILASNGKIHKELVMNLAK